MSSEPFLYAGGIDRHSSDARSVAVSPIGFLSASRDLTACVTGGIGTPHVQLGPTLRGHQAFVNFVLYHPGLPLLDNEPVLITGSNDKHIIVWNAATGDMEAVLDAHSEGVRCGVLHQPSLELVTGGWDGCSVVWDMVTGRPKQVSNNAHKTSVLCLAQLPGTNLMISGSGDKTLAVWDVESTVIVNTFRGHADAVQAVVAIDQDRFVSAGNEGVAIVWSVAYAGSIHRFQMHPSIVYCLAWNHGLQELYSSSEDGSVHVWSAASLTAEGPSHPVQCLLHPTVVWHVAVVEDSSEIITAGADGSLRLWSRNEDKMAPVDQLEALQLQCSSKEIDIKEAITLTSGAVLKVSALALEDQAAAHVGVEGERRAFRRADGVVQLYAWVQGGWVLLGVVVQGPNKVPYNGAALPREKQLYKGKEYDYVLPITLGTSQTHIPYNRGSNIFDAAQTYIYEHEHLGAAQDMREEVVKYILDNIDPADAALVGCGSTKGTPAAPSSSSAAAPLPAAPAPKPAPSQAAPLSAAQYQAPEVFTGLSTENVKKKLRELSPTSPVTDDVVDRIANGALSDGDTAVTVAAQLVGLVHSSSSASQFHVPAVDLLRACLSTSGPAAQSIAAATVDCQRDLILLLQQGTLDNAGKLISLRFLANLCANGQPFCWTAFADPNANTRLFRQVIGTQPIATPALKVATYALIQNLILAVPSSLQQPGGFVDDAARSAVWKALAMSTAHALLLVAKTDDVVLRLFAAWEAALNNIAPAHVVALRAELKQGMGSTLKMFATSDGIVQPIAVSLLGPE